MALVNESYLKLKAGYLFPEIGRRVRAFTEANPQARGIRLGIGDVTRPLPPVIIKAFHEGVEELAGENTFMGYGPEQGYEFLIDTIIKNAYNPIGVQLKSSELFISDGSKCDTANILDIFALSDVMRSNRDTTTKVILMVLILLIPFIGAGIYLLVFREKGY